jgi:hypothetical protein
MALRGAATAKPGLALRGIAQQRQSAAERGQAQQPMGCSSNVSTPYHQEKQMNPRFRTYPDSDDEHDRAIGYWHTGNVPEDTRPTPPSPTPGIHGGMHANYILTMARECEEFTVKELTQRFGLAHQGAYFYEVLNSLIAADLIELRIGKNRTYFLRGKEAPR